MQLLTPDELADILKISKTGVYRLIGRRKLRFYKIMGSIRFDKNDVMTFLKENQIDAIN